MNKEPLVSIILPAYNAERFIHQAVQSVISQLYTNWELIIINDGSTDGTASYLDSIVHNKIRIIHQKNKGVSAARNAGLDEVKGKFITFFDADDSLPLKSLEVRSTYLQEHPQVDIVDGEISVFNKILGCEVRCYKPYYQGLLLPRLLRLDDRVFFGPFYMFRKNKLGKVKFSEQMTHAEDLLFFMTLASLSNVSYGHINEVVYHYRHSTTSAMSNMDGLEKGYLKLLESVKSINGVSLFDQIFIRLKVATTLFLSWRARGNLKKAVSAVVKVLFPKN